MTPNVPWPRTRQAMVEFADRPASSFEQFPGAARGAARRFPILTSALAPNMTKAFPSPLTLLSPQAASGIAEAISARVLWLLGTRLECSG